MKNKLPMDSVSRAMRLLALLDSAMSEPGPCDGGKGPDAMCGGGGPVWDIGPAYNLGDGPLLCAECIGKTARVILKGGA